MEISPDTPCRLNLGAGNKRMEGWLAVGLEEQHEVRCDIRSIPLPDACADEALACHVVEHLTPWDVVPALKEWLRLLKPGAMLALELPDLFKCCRAVLAGKGPRDGLWGLYGEPLREDELMLHRWAYSPESLSTLLREAGFVKIKLRAPQFHAQRIDRDMRIEARKPI
jgi:predicted SAM-dependent methyltransferase